MANPIVEWEEWSQPSIEPFMEAVIHFASGDVVLSDEEIYNVSITAELFDSSYILFGPPSPATATLDIIDFEQAYNPTLNNQLLAGIQVDFYLCMYPALSATYGEDIVSSYEQPIPVTYMNEDMYATVIHINSTYLHPRNRYLLEFKYIYDGDSQEVTETFVVPGEWFERHIYALVKEESYTVRSVVIREIEYSKQPYGQFFTQEWSYDSSNHTARVELIDAMNDVLLLDNRVDGLLPSRNSNLKNFLVTLLNLYQEPYYIATHFNPVVPYTFYYATQASTIDNCLIALGASYCFMPDGSSAICDHAGIYDTGIVFTDEDVDDYNIQQTSAVSYDYTQVYVYFPGLETKSVVSYENYSTIPTEPVPLNVDGLFDILYVLTKQTNNVEYGTYTWNISGLYWSLTETYGTFAIYGSVLKTSEVAYSNIGGTAPYSIKDCKYIQEADQALQIASYIDSFYTLQYTIIELSFRGCPGIWLGARVTVSSDLYNIDADYMVIKVAFTYDGAVHTTLTLQRIL